MSTEITGPYRRIDLPKSPISTTCDPFTSRRIAQLRDKMIDRFPALSDLFHRERVSGYRAGYRDGLQARKSREVDHITAHPHIPANLTVALQQGPGDDATLRTVVTIDGYQVTVTLTSHGTGIPEPDSQTVWDRLCATVRQVAADDYRSDVPALLPRELAVIAWTGAHGPVTVTDAPGKPTRLRGFLGLALLPLARAGDLLAASAVSASAAAVIAGGSITPVTDAADAEPLPDLRPKVSVAEPQHPGREVHVHASATAKPRPRPHPTTAARATPRAATPSAHTQPGSGLRAPAQQSPLQASGAGAKPRPAKPAPLQSVTPPAHDRGHEEQCDDPTPDKIRHLRRRLDVPGIKPTSSRRAGAIRN